MGNGGRQTSYNSGPEERPGVRPLGFHVALHNPDRGVEKPTAWRRQEVQTDNKTQKTQQLTLQPRSLEWGHGARWSAKTVKQPLWKSVHGQLGAHVKQMETKEDITGTKNERYKEEPPGDFRTKKPSNQI